MSDWVLVALNAELYTGIAMNSNTYAEWLQTLKEGDFYLAYIAHRWAGDSLKKITIGRVSEKSIYVGDVRYRRNDGKCIGHDGNLLKPATVKEIESVKLQDKKRVIKKHIEKNLGFLTQEQADKILDVFKDMAV
jgi:hypothetical protein